MLFGRKKLFENHQIGVLFVCMGNICRSPAAEGIFKHYVNQRASSDSFFIDSAGTLGSHAGQKPDTRMIKAAECRGYNLDSEARKVVKKDIEEFDLILAMDFDNLMNLYNLSKGEPEHVRLYGSFLEGAQNSSMAKSVPDPYYGNASGFELVLDMIEDATPKIYDYCMNGIKK